MNNGRRDTNRKRTGAYPKQPVRRSLQRREIVYDTYAHFRKPYKARWHLPAIWVESSQRLLHNPDRHIRKWAYTPPAISDRPTQRRLPPTSRRDCLLKGEAHVPCPSRAEKVNRRIYPLLPAPRGNRFARWYQSRERISLRNSSHSSAKKWSVTLFNSR